MAELDAEQVAIIEKVEKLLRLANKNPNEAEAAAAAAKAQELLTAYNLDMAMVGEVSSGNAKREQAKLKGGAYLYQRDLWNSVARLNFCLHWNDTKRSIYPKKRKLWDGTWQKYDWVRWQWHHFIVGRVVNVVATRTMAEYLEGAIERVLRERLADRITGIVPNTQLFSKWAVSYRSGAAMRVVEKLDERRNEMVAEENRKKAEAARAGTSTATALTISSYKDAETDANMDFLYGEGFSAKQAAQRAERARLAREAEEEYTRWAAANPEEARAEEAKRRKEAEKRTRKPRREKQYTGDSGAYWAGYDAAESISIDQQVDRGDRALRIGR